jgi:general secretion pathway protein D
MKKTLPLLLAAGLLWGCATLSHTYRLGYEAELNRNWDEAVRHYEKASLENPKESVYRLALMRARTSAGLACLQEARSLAGMDKRDEAIAAYKKALSYDPMNRALLAELEVYAAGPQAPVEKAADKPLEPPVKLKVSAERVQLRFANAALRSIFQALGKHAGVNFLFDEQFRDVPLTIDLTDRTFEQAVGFLCLASKNFSRIIDERTVIIVPDQPMKRLQYELNAIRTFYLSNLNAQEVQNSLAMMIRTQYKAPSIIVDKNLNSITVRDTPSAVNLAGKLLRTWDKAKGEVIIDLEIMEVSRIKMREFGIDLNQHAIGGRYSGGGQVPEDGWFGLKDLDLSKGTNFQISLPTAYLNFLQTDANTKIIAQPRLRGVGSEDIKYLVGQKVPVPQTTFTPFAAGGVSQQPIVNYTYQDVGIDVKIKPRIHTEREVTLDLEIKITSISGTGIADIPIITTREVKNVVRLRDGETNLLAGLLKDEERRSLKGIAGLSDVPLLGSLFSSTKTSLDQTDVILTITPYIIRTVPMTEEDSRPLWVEVEGLSGGGGGDARPSEEEFVPEAEAEPDVEPPAEPGDEQPPAEEAEEAPGRGFIVLNPADFEVPKGREFRISVEVRSEPEIASLTVNLRFDAQVVRLKQVSEGGLGRQLGAKVPFLSNIDNASGACTIGLSSPTPGKGIKGGGILAVLIFESLGPGEGVINVSGVTANGPTGAPLQFESNESRLVVR